MIKENQKILNRILIVFDIITILTTFIFSWVVRFKTGIFSVAEGYLSYKEYILPVVFIIPVYLLTFNYFRLYDPYRFKDSAEEFINILKANILSLFLFIITLFLFKQINYSRYLLLLFSLLSIIIIALERILIRAALRRARKVGLNQKYILFVGATNLTVEFIKRMLRNKQWGYKAIGILDDNIEVNKIFNPVPIIGKINELEKILTENEVDEVYITLKLKEYEKLKNIIFICEKVGVRTQIIPDYYKYIPAKPYVEEVEGLPIINIRYVPLDNIMNKVIKRIFDIIISLSGILIFLPVMLASALIIKLTSPGPVIFRQERVGLNRKPFVMYKFRSMNIQKESLEEKAWTTVNDVRKTRFGKFIRKTSIDELPQFFNVLKGDMSIIGPRPERPFFVEKFKEEIPKYMLKHLVRPGISGWAQVNGLRGDTSIVERIEYDIYYIENWSFMLDLKIVFLTLFKGFFNDNAY